MLTETENLISDPKNIIQNICLLNSVTGFIQSALG